MSIINSTDTICALATASGGALGIIRISGPQALEPKEGKVLVEGVNMIHKHVKARKQGDESGIIDAEGAIYASKVALWCDTCKKGVRVKHVVNDGKKIRVCAKCGKEL